MPDTTQAEIARLEQEYRNNPEGRLFVHLAEAYRRAGELEKARDILSEGLQRHSDYLSARIVLAQVESGLGEEDRALRVWREVVELDPENELALWALAETEYNQGNTRESLAYYKRLLELGVDDAELDEMITLLESSPPAAVENGPGDGASRDELDRSTPSRSSTESTRHIIVDSSMESLSTSDNSNDDMSNEPDQSVASEGTSETRESYGRPANQSRGTSLTLTDSIGLSDLLVRLLEHRNTTFHADSSLTRMLAVAIGEELELEATHLEGLALAGLLSDLGATLLSSRTNGRADEPEGTAASIRREVAVSLQLLQGITLPSGVHESVQHQHERWDGQGYPDGLKEEEIPYGARVIAVARACAGYLTRNQSSAGATNALDELQRNAGSRFDPVVVNVLRRVFQRRTEHGIGYGVGGRVLVVHPDELRALSVATQLHAEGYVSELGTDAASARNALRSSAPNAVVLGVNGTRAEAMALIKEVRNAPGIAGIPLVVIDVNDPQTRVDLLTAGADVCFSSELSYREVKATLDALLRRREELERTDGRKLSRETTY